MDEIRHSKLRAGRGSLALQAILLALVFTLLLLPAHAFGASIAWDGGCSADISWSCPKNWKGDVLPGPVDTVVFNSNSPGNAIVDPEFGGTIAGLQLVAGYTGSVALDRSFAVSQGYSQKTGSFMAGGHLLSLRTVTLSGGSFEASSATTSISGNLKITGTPNFDANGGVIDFSGTGGSLRCGGVVFHLVAFGNASGAKTVGGDCILPLGANPVAGGGSIKLNGILTGTGTLSSAGTLTLGVGGGLLGFINLTANAVVVDGTYDFGDYDSIDVKGKFVVSASGDVIASPGTSSFQSDFTINPSAVFDANGGAVEFGGTTNGRLSCGNQTFNLVRVSNTAGMKTINADCALPLGADPILGGSGSGRVTLYGTLSGSGVVTAESIFTIGSTGGISGFNGLSAMDSLVMADADADFSSFKSFRIDGNYRQAGGSTSVPSGADFNGQFVLKAGSAFEAPVGHMSVAKELTISPAAAFDPNGGTLDIDGSQGAVLSCGGATFSHVTFSHIENTKLVESSCSLPLGSNPVAGDGGSIRLKGSLSGGGTLTTSGVLTLEGAAALMGFSGLNADDLSVNTDCSFSPYAPFTVGGDLRIGSGADLVAPSGIASVGGDFVNGGEFVANGGTVVLDGSHQAIYGDTSFATLRKVASSVDTLTFEAGATQTVAGSLELRGGDWEHLLTLASSSPGRHWRIDRAGATEVEFVSVADSTKVGTPIVARESFSEGGNSGWSISGPAVQLVLEAQSTTPTAGAVYNLAIVAKDAYGNTSASYTGTHSLTFGPVADSPSGAHATVANSSGTAVNFGIATPIGFNEGVATVSGSKNGAMTLVKVGSTSIVVSDGSISNGSGLAVTVNSGTATSLTLAVQTTTPVAGETDNLAIIAKDAYGNTSASYTGTHSLTFGPVADSPSGAHATVANSSGTAVNFGIATPIGFNEGVATVSGSKNGAMTLVKVGSTSIVVSDGSISNGSGLAVTVSPGVAARIAWTHATVSKGTLSSPCLFTCTATEMSSTGILKANVSVTDGSGNTVSNLGSGHTVSVTAASGTITGGTLTIAASGPAESTTQFTYTSSKGGAVSLTASTAGGTVYTPAAATMMR